MTDAKIVLALEKFKRDYAWDKSLIRSDVITPSSLPPSPPHVNSAIEEFINASGK